MTFLYCALDISSLGLCDLPNGFASCNGIASVCFLRGGVVQIHLRRSRSITTAGAYCKCVLRFWVIGPFSYKGFRSVSLSRPKCRASQSAGSIAGLTVDFLAAISIFTALVVPFFQPQRRSQAPSTMPAVGNALQSYRDEGEATQPASDDRTFSSPCRYTRRIKGRTMNMKVSSESMIQ